MKATENKIKKIDATLDRIEEIDNKMIGMELVTLLDITEHSKLMKQEHQEQANAKRLIKSLMKDFDLEISSYGQTSTISFYGWTRLFNELKGKFYSAKKILCGYDNYSIYTQPISA